MKTAKEEIGVLIKLIKPSAVCVLSDRMFSNWQKEMTLINYLDIQSCVAVCIIRVQMLGSLPGCNVLNVLGGALFLCV